MVKISSKRDHNGDPEALIFSRSTVGLASHLIRILDRGYSEHCMLSANPVARGLIDRTLAIALTLPSASPIRR